MNDSLALRSDAVISPSRRDLIEVWTGGKSEHTIRAYCADLAGFAAFLDRSEPIGEFAHWFLAHGQGDANYHVLRYRNYLIDEGYASATIARKIAAIGSIVELARVLGLVAWRIEISAPSVEGYRDTRGPGEEGFRELLKAAETIEANAMRARNVAILHLLHDLALRRGEVASLDLEHVAKDCSSVAILGKGRRRRETLSVPGPCREALAAWIEVRGDRPGPLFFRLDRDSLDPTRLTTHSIYNICKKLGESIGIKVTPHGLRHTAITTALDRTNGNLREVKKFSRHKKTDTLMVYDDRRLDAAGEIAEAVSEDRSENDSIASA